MSAIYITLNRSNVKVKSLLRSAQTGHVDMMVDGEGDIRMPASVDDDGAELY